MRTLITLITITFCFNLSAQSLQESLNKALKKEQTNTEENSLQSSLNKALKKGDATITSFEANVDLELDAVQLKWEKSFAINTASYIIEKSANKEDWLEIATIYGAPHVNQPTEFFHLDDNPSSNLSYYRLKSINKDGKESISNIVPVNYLKKQGATAGMNLHPDFSEDYKIINIAFEEVFEKEILIVIRDKRGNEFYSKVIINVEDDSLVAVPIEQEIPKGDYLITATSENQIYSQNVIVL
ncbi:MAG: hypothetical protein COB15_00745 [Flavobacteriales bacterium]|nr:MAG: hypothetical protein COB15_00745 [Flavobacteriales bacterium]